MLDSDFNRLIQGDDLDALVEWFDSQKRKPPVADRLTAANITTSAAIREYLVGDAMKRKITAKGWTDAAAAALSGKLEHLALAEERDADFTARSNAGTPMMIAAKKGHTEFIAALLDRGVPAPETGGYNPNSPLAEAIRNGHREIIERLIERGAVNSAALNVAVGYGELELVDRLVEAGCTVTHETAKQLSSAEMVSKLVELGWDPDTLPPFDPNKGSIYRRWAAKTIGDASAKRDFFEALVDAGVPFDAQAIADVLGGFRGEPFVLEPVLDACDDLTAKVVGYPDEPKRHLTVCALEEHPVAVAEALAERGCPIPSGLRVEPSWRDADEKRAWLASRGIEEKGLSTSAFLELNDFTPEEVTARFEKTDGLLGVWPGMSAEELERAGFGESNGGDKQRLDVTISDDVVGEVVYELDTYRREYPEAIVDTLTERYGPPIGANVPRWNTDFGVIELSWKRYHGPGIVRTTVRAVPGEVRGGKKVSDVAAFEARLDTYLRDLSPDVLDSGFIAGVEVAQKDGGLAFSLALEGTDHVAIVDWTDPPLSADGDFSEDLLEALVRAANDELRFASGEL